MRRQPYHGALILLVAAGVVAGSALVHAQDGPKESADPPRDVKSILLRMLQHVTAIKSIHYTYQTVRSRTPADKPSITSTTIGEFAYSKGKIFESRDNAYKPDAMALTREAYDGKFMQRLELAEAELFVGTKLQKSSYGSAWLQPLSFVLGPDDALRIEAVAKEEAWLELSRKAKLEEPQTVAGHPCEVISFVRPPREIAGLPEARAKIYAATALASYPVRYTYETVDSTAHSDVAEFQKMETAAGIVIVPTKYLSEAKNPEGKVISKGETKLKIKSLNEQLDDAKFYLNGNAPGKVRYIDMAPEEQEEFEGRRKAAFSKAASSKKDGKQKE
jgi:hypothetical protein